MPIKVFTVSGEFCPFGLEVVVDSRECRNCPNYYRTGTGLFFWCKAGDEPTATPKTRRRSGVKRGKSPKNGEISAKRTSNRRKPPR